MTQEDFDRVVDNISMGSIVQLRKWIRFVFKLPVENGSQNFLFSVCRSGEDKMSPCFSWIVVLNLQEVQTS